MLRAYIEPIENFLESDGPVQDILNKVDQIFRLEQSLMGADGHVRERSISVDKELVDILLSADILNPSDTRLVSRFCIELSCVCFGYIDVGDRCL